MEFIKDFCWVTDMCRRDIWTLRRVKKHDGRGVSLHDLFLTSCCVKAPWLCNLPCGLKQCRLDFFFFSSSHELSLCWAGVCFPPLRIFPWPCFFSGSNTAGIRSHGPKPASPAIFCLLEQMAFVCDPFHTLEDKEGTRRDEEGGRRAKRGAPPLGVTGRWGWGRRRTQLEIHGA